LQVVCTPIQSEFGSNSKLNIADPTAEFNYVATLGLVGIQSLFDALF